MSGFALAIEYLTGYAVATDAADREKVEWPPHPARVFMAMVAALHESGRPEGGEAALRWLEGLPAPVLHLPAGVGQPRSVVETYVPVNDKTGPAAAVLQGLPTLTRSRQPRTFPRVHVGVTAADDDRAVRIVYESADRDAFDRHEAAVRGLCRATTRIGHSSSLVALRLEDEPPEPDAETLLPGFGPERLRTPAPGLLDELDAAFGEGGRRVFFEHLTAVQVAEGKAKAAAKAAFEEATGQKHGSAVAAPPPRRPLVSTTTRYGKLGDAARPVLRVRPGGFSRDLVAFSLENGPRLDLVSAAAVCAGVRGMLMKKVANPVPAWVSGHAADGSADRTTNGHVAVLPLGFAGESRWSDGRLMGVALALPSAVDAEERARVLGAALFDPIALQPRAWELKLGRLGDWNLRRVEDGEARESLLPEASGAGTASPATGWATATPIVLDRFPHAKRDRGEAAWREEVAGIIADSCVRAGVIEDPAAVRVETGTTSWLRGSPRATAKRRRLRLKGDDTSAPLGSGFPSYPAKGTRGPRPQVHALLKFAEPVIGPLLLGAGRFGGYGLCRPLRCGGNDR